MPADNVTATELLRKTVEKLLPLLPEDKVIIDTTLFRYCDSMSEGREGIYSCRYWCKK